MMRLVLIILLSFILFLPEITNSQKLFSANRIEKKLARGVHYIKKNKRIERGPVTLHILKVNLDVSDIAIKPAFAHDDIQGLATVEDITKQQKGIAAINGSFFTKRFPYLPIGRVIVDGLSLYKDNQSRSLFGLTYGNKPFFDLLKLRDSAIVNYDDNYRIPIWGINRPRKKSEIILYTPAFGKTTKTNRYGHEIIVQNGKVADIIKNKGNTPIPEDGYVISFHGNNRIYTKKLKIGSKIDIHTKSELSRFNIKHAITGGPRLLKDSKVVVHPYFSVEKFSPYFYRPNARTAIGINNLGELIFLVIDKNSRSVGATFTELAWILKGLDVEDAIALDGGSSSSIYVNHPELKIKSNRRKLPSVNNAIVIAKEYH